MTMPIGFADIAAFSSHCTAVHVRIATCTRRMLLRCVTSHAVKPPARCTVIAAVCATTARRSAP